MEHLIPHLGCSGRLLRSVLIIIAGAFPAAAFAQDSPDYSITLTSSYLTRTIESSFSKSMEGKPFNWDSGTHIELSKNNIASVHVHANLVLDTNEFAKANPDIVDLPDLVELEVDFNLGFGCNWKHPTVSMGANNLNVSPGLPLWADILVGPFGNYLTAVVVPAIISDFTTIEQDIEDQINAQLGDQLGDLNLEFCPQISVDDSPNVRFDFGEGDFCESGDERFEACSRDERGSGSHGYCINGYWVYEYDCESIHKVVAGGAS